MDAELHKKKIIKKAVKETAKVETPVIKEEKSEKKRRENRNKK